MDMCCAGLFRCAALSLQQSTEELQHLCAITCDELARQAPSQFGDSVVE
jgi:hypothetical protein